MVEFYILTKPKHMSKTGSGALLPLSGPDSFSVDSIGVVLAVVSPPIASSSTPQLPLTKEGKDNEPRQVLLTLTLASALLGVLIPKSHPASPKPSACHGPVPLIGRNNPSCSLLCPSIPLLPSCSILSPAGDIRPLSIITGRSRSKHPGCPLSHSTSGVHYIRSRSKPRPACSPPVYTPSAVVP